MAHPLAKLFAALIVVSPAIALADHTRPEYRADGTVRVGDRIFQTRPEYYRSAEFRARGGRCGAEHEKLNIAFASPMDCSDSHTTINPEYDDNRVFVIQVVFHIIQRTDGVGAITDDLIDSQIDILNEDFLALTGTPGEPGANVKIQFALARFDPQGNPTTGINRVTNNAYFNDPGSSGTNQMKIDLNWDTTRYLNMYTNDAAGYLGYATFPMYEAGGPEDGVVLLWDSVGRDSPSGPPYDQGRTATHEVGHYLGLFHTFQDGCSTPSMPYDTGDLISDTVPEPGPEFGCTPGPSSCGGGNLPIENYMDYTDDTCMNRFSVEQANRMRCALVNYRTINTAPTAAFSYTADELVVAFTNSSTDAETPTMLAYEWEFGDGQMSTEASPSHTYAGDGTYPVTLTVTDPGSGFATTMQSVVVVMTPIPPDAPGGGGDDDDGGGGGGCCQADSGGSSAVLCAFVAGVAFFRRRRRSR
jgi:hypothetical protein